MNCPCTPSQHSIVLHYSGGERVEITGADVINRSQNVSDTINSWIRDQLEAAAEQPKKRST